MNRPSTTSAGGPGTAGAAMAVWALTVGPAMHAAMPWRDAFILPIVNLWRATEAEEEKMFTLHICQHQRPRNSIEHGIHHAGLLALKSSQVFGHIIAGRRNYPYPCYIY